MVRSGTLSSITLIAGASILGGVGGNPIIANASLTTNISTYTSTTPLVQFANVVATGSAVLTANVLPSLKNLAGNIFPVVTNAIPSNYTGTLGNTPSSGLTGVISIQANNILGNGDLGKFSQILGASIGYVVTTNQLIRSAQNAANTAFTTQDNLITGGVSDVSAALAALGRDLANLGDLINLSDLQNFGNPSALLKQIGLYSPNLPGLTTALMNAGFTEEQAGNYISIDFDLRLEKLAYKAMTQVTGDNLTQMLRLLKVVTPNINTLADLLNPYKLFPTSFQTLTAPTSNGLRGVYIDSKGTVNSKLETELPSSILRPLQGNPTQGIN